MRNLTLAEAVCLIAGAGIGGGVMALPFLVYRTGLLPAFLVMLVAYIVTAVLHIMVAEL
jgi:amino acid permease